MVMVELFVRFLLILLSGVLACAATYAAYRRPNALLWGYLSVWILEIPAWAAMATAAQNLQHFDLFMHAFGIPVVACLLVIADILLIELSLVGFLRPVSFLLPKSISRLVGIERCVRRLQKYHIIPHTVRVEVVFGAAILGGIIELAVFLVAGVFV
jgi:hypothetical protein